MRKKHLIFLSVMMALLTTFLICFLFVQIDATIANLVLITAISVAGYGTSALYYYTWKENI